MDIFATELLKMERTMPTLPWFFSPLIAVQAAKIEKFNPNFKERYVESAHPGKLLSQDAFMVGKIKGVGAVFFPPVRSRKALPH